MRLPRIALLPLLGCLLAPPVTADDTPQGLGLVGSWRWTSERNGCTEIYSFDADGGVHTVSGAEITRQLYVLLGRSDDGRRVRLGLVTLEDNGLGDCGDIASDDAGYSYEIWLEFLPDGDHLLMCYTEAGPEGFGPLGRYRGI